VTAKSDMKEIRGKTKSRKYFWLFCFKCCFHYILLLFLFAFVGYILSGKKKRTALKIYFRHLIKMVSEMVKEIRKCFLLFFFFWRKKNSTVILFAIFYLFLSFCCFFFFLSLNNSFIKVGLRILTWSKIHKDL
jgi:hypothetical protein